MRKPQLARNNRFACCLLGVGLVCGCAKHEVPAPQTPLEIAAVASCPLSAQPTATPSPQAPPAPGVSAEPDSGKEDEEPSDKSTVLFTTEAPPKTPPFLVQFAAVVPGKAAPVDFLGHDRVLLFATQVTCAQATGPSPPEHVEISLDWQTPSKTTFSVFTFRGGKSTGYIGVVEILSAPKTKGAKGRIKLHKERDTNVEGGEVDALWCG